MEIFDWQDQDVFLISGDAQYIVKGHDLHVKSLSHLQMYWPHLFPTDLSLWNYKANRNYALIHLPRTRSHKADSCQVMTVTIHQYDTGSLSKFSLW